MQSKLLLVIFLFVMQGLDAQILESTSRPYRFNIDKFIYLEANSPVYKFYVIPVSELMTLKMKEKLNSLNLEDEDKKLILSKAKTEVIQEVGEMCLNSRMPQFYFIPEKLNFQIVLSDFTDFELSIPLSEVENFKQNFDKLTYTNAQFLYTDEEKFVIKEVDIRDPIANKTYTYSNTALERYKDHTFDFLLID